MVQNLTFGVLSIDAFHQAYPTIDDWDFIETTLQKHRTGSYILHHSTEAEKEFLDCAVDDYSKKNFKVFQMLLFKFIASFFTSILLFKKNSGPLHFHERGK